jgi:molybdopterin-containing oxidoreductase family iron-sulfur binding subunit
MEKKSVLVDMDLCYGCFSCEVGCKQEHGLPAGINFITVHQVGPTRIGGKLKMDFVPMACKHCGKPACVEACPEDAIYKRSDGIVLISEEKCTGCQICMEACPFGAPQYVVDKGIVQKCDLCVDRIDRGQVPACVHHCPTGALVFGNPNNLSDRMQKRQAESVAGHAAPAAGDRES